MEIDVHSDIDKYVEIIFSTELLNDYVFFTL